MKVKVFGASWCSTCGPNKEALQKIEGVEVEYFDMDTAKGMDEGTELSVRGIPTLIAEDGSRRVGGMSEGDLREWLEL